MEETTHTRTRSIWGIILLYLVKTGVILTALVYTSYHVVGGYELGKTYLITRYARLMGKLTRVEVVKEYIPTHALPLDDLIAQVSKERKVPAVVLQAIVLKESSGGKNLYRFEPTVYARLKNKYGENDETKMLSSSHGVGQVMGFNAKPRCGIHWSELYDPYKSLDCSAKILREELDSTRGRGSIGDRIWNALRAYNGSGDRAEKYASDVMSTIGTLMMNNLKEEL